MISKMLDHKVIRFCVQRLKMQSVHLYRKLCIVHIVTNIEPESDW